MFQYNKKGGSLAALVTIFSLERYCFLLVSSTTCTGGFFGSECFLGVSSASWFELAVAVLLFAALSFVLGKIALENDVLPLAIRLRVTIVSVLMFGTWGMSAGLRTLAFHKAGYVEGYALLIPPLLAVAGYFAGLLLAKACLSISHSMAERRNRKSTP